MEDHIIILLNETNNLDHHIDSFTQKKAHLIFTGKVVDDMSDLPIPYVNISIFGKAIGTMSNTEGEFILKLPSEFQNDTLVFSCVGYSLKRIPIRQFNNNSTIRLNSEIIQIKEIKINYVTPEFILDMAINNLDQNYFTKYMMNKAFYRETIIQNENYINVSEAVLQILKTPYNLFAREDDVHVLKGRKSPDVSPLQWIDFKLQGGPKTITQLDLIKSTDTFLDPRFRYLYSYEIDRIIWHFGRPVFVIKFRPIKNVSFLCYEGEIYIDRETYGIYHINFKLGKYGLKLASRLLIKKKSRGLSVKAVKAEYTVDYKKYNGKLYFSSARANVAFKIKDRSEKINSVFESTSELLVTDIEQSQIRRFPKNQAFSIKEIFSEYINVYDPKFWGNYNIIKPDEDLVNALKMNTKLVGNPNP